MLRVPHLVLPPVMPSSEAISSFGNTALNYEPEFWEVEYLSYRYLGRVTDRQLVERYEGILRNLQAIVCRERDVIPIQSFLSSWYWFRKEHQTRLELVLRSVPATVKPPLDVVFNNRAEGAPVRPRSPNAGDVLFRYDQEKFVRQIAAEGTIRIRPASEFEKMTGDLARQDDEATKRHFMSGAHTRVTTGDGRPIPVRGDIQSSVSAPNYYMFCVACDWDRDLFEAFDGANSCLAITDVESFARRIERASASELPGWYFHHNPVEYFDPYERSRNEYFSPSMSKDFKFAYQREYRFVWMPMAGQTPNGFRFLKAGNLTDVATVYVR